MEHSVKLADVDRCGVAGSFLKGERGGLEMRDNILDYRIVEHLPDGSQRFWTEEQFRQAYGCSLEEYRGDLREGSSQFWVSLRRLLRLLGKGVWVLLKVGFAMAIGAIGLAGRAIGAVAEGIFAGVLGVLLCR